MSDGVSKKRQKFDRFDLVKIAKDLGPRRRHFKSDCEAIVMASYKDSYGCDNIQYFRIFIPGEGEVSWYKEEHLTLIKPYQKELYYQWLGGHESKDN